MKTSLLLPLAASLAEVNAYWRLSCGQIQTGRIDPVITPDTVSGHTHVLAGAYNMNISSNYDSLTNAFCTSCSVQADKSAYWTPLLYYKNGAGQYQNVRNYQTVIYYLPRGVGNENTVPFPKGFKMISGNPFARAYNATAKAYGGNPRYTAAPISDRVSFVCIKNNNTESRSNHMEDFDCPNGLRAQITFPSCWDGVNPYKSDNSHVAYLSGITNGICPPSHPTRIPHLFYELYYFPTTIDTSDGGQFVFAQGDPTGYGFHGDFVNGWDIDVLTAGINQCLVTDNNGKVENCAPFQPSYDDNAADNCPEQPSYWDEPVKGTLTELPGCNPIQYGPGDAASVSCSKFPSKTNAQRNLDGVKRSWPTPGSTTYTTSAGVATYKGCYNEPATGRVFTAGTKADSSMTIETCAAFCKTKKATWFGVEYGRECYCGTAAPTTTTVTDSQCDMACKGDISQWCGAGKLLNVYQLA